MLDPIRLIFRTCLRIIRDIDGLFLWVTHLIFRPKYQLEGACKQRGICCQNIAIGLSPKLFRIKRWVIAYYEFVYNFKFIHALEEEQVLLFRCRYLKNQRCGIHWKRPYICRRYPVGRFFTVPNLLPGCGFHFKLKTEARKQDKIVT